METWDTARFFSETDASVNMITDHYRGGGVASGRLERTVSFLRHHG
jgi:hypothetical protein